MTDDSDELIWQRVLSGQAQPYALVWRRHRDRVFRHHIRCGTPPQDAEDLTALTFLELWRRRSDVRFVDGSLLPWLIVTAQNVSRNSARARRRHERFLASLPPPGVEGDASEAVVAHADERWTALEETLKLARTVDRQLLVMTAVEGFTIREAAAALSISAPAAKMRLNRLRGRVRGALNLNQPQPEGES